MFTHVTEEYICPICLGLRGVENENTMLKQADRVYQDELVSAFINSFWIGRNKGHVIIVPNEHFENLYSIPAEVGARIFEASQKISLAMKHAYECDGTTLRQNNEPAGDQHAFHYHLHVFPRYDGDEFNQNLAKEKYLADETERQEFAEKLKRFLS